MTMQEQARALGDPTRHRLFRHIADADGPVTVAELTDQVELGHNAVRQHLAKLVAAGLLEEHVEERHRAGRPRLLYTLAPGALGRWDTDGPYRDLSRLLLEVLQSGASPVEVGRRAGLAGTESLDPSATGVVARAEAEAVAASSCPAGVALIVEEMARRGFDPCHVDLGDGTCEVVLRACPFADAAADGPAVVCAVHEGIAKGIAEAAGDVEVVGLALRDPHRAGCRLRLARPAGLTAR